MSITLGPFGTLPIPEGLGAGGQDAISLYDALGYRRRWQVLSLVHPPYVSASAPLVVGGCPRSGTTLTQALLGAHPEVDAGPESTVFLRRITRPAEIDRRFGFADGFVEQLQRESRSQAEFVDLFQRACLARSGRSVWAEKTPWNVLRLDFIWAHFPKARFIHVVRDGRDVLCSLRRKTAVKVGTVDRWSLKGVRACADYWAEHVAAGLRRRGDARYLEVLYRDLVREPEATLRRILQFAGLDWDPAILDSQGMRAALSRVGHADPLHADRLIHDESVARWEDEFTWEELDLFQRRAAWVLAQLGCKLV